MHDLCGLKRLTVTEAYNQSGQKFIHLSCNQNQLASAGNTGERPDEYAETLEQTREKIDEPRQYIVYLINDDYTTFEFVVQVLVTIFKKSIEQAVKITNDVHHKGKGACGIYSKQIAETKIALVEDASSSAGFPLKCDMEEA